MVDKIEVGDILKLVMTVEDIEVYLKVLNIVRDDSLYCEEVWNTNSMDRNRYIGMKMEWSLDGLQECNVTKIDMKELLVVKLKG